MLEAVLLGDTSPRATYVRGLVTVYEGEPFQLILLGSNIHRVSKAKFTSAPNSWGGECSGRDGSSHHQAGSNIQPTSLEMANSK